MEDNIDIQRFISRTKMKHREIADFVGSSTGLVGLWAINKSVPSYDKILKLIELGLTAEELFGPRLAGILMKNSSVEKMSVDKEQVMAAVKEALRDLSNG